MLCVVAVLGEVASLLWWWKSGGVVCPPPASWLRQRQQEQHQEVSLVLFRSVAFSVVRRRLFAALRTVVFDSL